VIDGNSASLGEKATTEKMPARVLEKTSSQRFAFFIMTLLGLLSTRVIMKKRTKATQ